MGRTRAERELLQALPDDPEIKKEYDRLIKLFQTAPKKQLDLARKLISRAAFLSITIDRLEDDIARNGYETTYQNGANQSGTKKSAAAELHVSYTKNLIGVMKQLQDILDPHPEGRAKEVDDFDAF